MKKLLLTGVLFTMLSFSAKAQLISSFEADEEFEIGEINGQNFWQISSAATTSANFTVASGFNATDGDNVLRVEGGGVPSTSLQGIYSAVYNFTGASYTISEDIFIDAMEENGSDAYFDQFAYDATAQSLTLASRVVFSFDGTLIMVTGLDGTALNYEEIGEYPMGEWFNFKTTYDFTAGTINYYINDELVLEGDAWGAQSVAVFAYRYDNYNTGFSVDNINFIAPTADVKDNSLSMLSVFPNPATDVINVANAGLIKSIKVADLNGRTVKGATFEGVDTARVSISDLSSGVYIMTVASDKGTVTKKIVKN
ncbi:T9SS type A sorting domain-containing protein [Flavobacterium sp. RHBU_24]|uniref:T9SS type A sorting domain-containing protein n=1 Tax=Flavobacterium sp. RHBU_24 TaxID=3391185 RepID=UPI0039856223